MLGNQKQNSNSGNNAQIFHVQVNTKEYVNSGIPPYFDVFYKVTDENGTEHKVRLKTDSVGGYLREFYVYDDTFGKKTNKKFVISLDEEECPFMNEKGEPTDVKVRNTYIVSSVFSMKGQELASKLCRVVEEGKTNYISIRFQKQFEKNPNTGAWDVVKKDKEGKEIYNINVFFKGEGDEKATMVMPLFAKNSDFATHELNDEWVEAWEKASEVKSNVPIANFFEELINGTYRDAAFSMFKDRMGGKGFDVEMEIKENGRPKYKFNREDNPDAHQAETVVAGITDDDLPF